MYDEFHVPDVLIVLLYMWRLNTQGDLLKKKVILQIIDERFPDPIPGNFISASMLCITFAQLACCCCGLSHATTILIVLSYKQRYKQRYKQSCDWRSHCTANIARTPSWKWERNVDQFSAAVCWEKRWVTTVKTAVWQTTAEHARWVYTNYFQLSKFYCFKRVTFSVTSKAPAPKFTEIFTRKLGLDKGYFW